MEYKVIRIKGNNNECLLELISDNGEKWSVKKESEFYFEDELYFEDENLLKIINILKQRGYKVEVFSGTLKEFLDGKITDRQKYYIHSLIKEIGWDDEKYRSFLFENYKVYSSKDLSKRSASDLIGKLIDIRDGINKTDYSNLPDIECEV
ncbi:MAG: hypothetical protein ABDH34_08325 [Dictyoglomus thermophilum]